MRIRTTTISRYYDIFVNLKRDSDNGVKITTIYIRSKYNKSSAFCSALLKLNVLVYSEKGLVWNESIKPSTKLAYRVAVETNTIMNSYGKNETPKPLVATFSDKPIVTETPKVKRTYTKRKVVLPKVDKQKIEKFSKTSDKKQRVFSIAWGLITIKY